MPKVSVIIPVYGVEKYIERCARSLFEQTLDDIEYLFIDDCTPDNSVEILNNVLEEYPHRKSQVIIHRMEQNSGQAKVREWGMKNATGEYVIHCDSDDWVDNTLYKRMYNKATKEHADVVVCDFIVTDGEKMNKKSIGCSSTDKMTFIQRLLFQKESWSLWNKMFLRIPLFNNLQYPNGNMGEDMVLCIQLMLNCNSISYVSEGYYYYFCNESSISNLLDSSLHVRNYERLKINTDMLINILYSFNIPQKKWIINNLQYNATAPLLNVVHSEKKYRRLWNNTYPGANRLYIFNTHVNIKRRIKCLLAMIGIYPFYKDRIK